MTTHELTTHELTDDGTLDTVLRCTDCGAESRYTYQPAEGAKGTAGLEAYNEFIRWAAADADERHGCPCPACGRIDYGDGPDHAKGCATLEGDGHGHQGWVVVNLASGAPIGELYQDRDKARAAAAVLRAGDELHAANDSIYVYALAPVDPGKCSTCGSDIPTSTSELQA